MLARLRAGALHDRVGVFRSRAGVNDPRCNIVHIERPAQERLREAGRRAAREWLQRQRDGDVDDADGQRQRQPRHARASAVLRAKRAREDARERLVPDWMAKEYPELAEAIAEDAEELARMVGGAVGGGGGDDNDGSSVSARLEALSWQPCPKWHADTVGARGLVTYAGSGGGTQYVPNARVARGWQGDAPFVAGVRPPRDNSSEAPFEAAGLGDLLLLKGHSCPGMMGMGAVHRSPPMDDEVEEEDEEVAPRLVLTVDDALPPCECCPPPDDTREGRADGAVRRREAAAAVR